MRPSTLRRACLSHADAEETYPFGPETAAFKVHGRIFALTRLTGRPLSVSLKCEPEIAERLRGSYPAIVPGHHLNKRHWNTVTLDGSVPRRLVIDMIEDSYDLVVEQLPKKLRNALRIRQALPG